MLGLRFAAEKLNKFDTAYAERAAKDMGGAHDNPLSVMLGGSPVSSVDIQGESTLEKAVAVAAQAGIQGTNIGYRYGLPAAGVTLAGKGLFDLTQAMGNTTQGELPM